VELIGVALCVMAGLTRPSRRRRFAQKAAAAAAAFRSFDRRDLDGRVKPDHDGGELFNPKATWRSRHNRLASIGRMSANEKAGRGISTSRL
jgi:hypothetical protein